MQTQRRKTFSFEAHNDIKPNLDVFSLDAHMMLLEMTFHSLWKLPKGLKFGPEYEILPYYEISWLCHYVSFALWKVCLCLSGIE